MKNVFIMEEETVNAGSAFIIRDAAGEQVGRHAELQVLQLRWKRGRATHPERKDVGDPPMRRSAGRRRPSHSGRSGLPGLCLPSANYWFLFPHDLPGDPPCVSTTPAPAKMDLEVKASGKSKTHYGLDLSLDF